MKANQSWAEALKEISAIIRLIPEIKYLDLWAEQTNDPSEQYPFPIPAAFIEISTPKIDDLGQNIQDLEAHVKVYLLYIPVYDTHREDNTYDLDVFGELLKKINVALQGISGQNFSTTTRIAGPSREHAQPYEWLYSQTFKTIIRDYSACRKYTEGQGNELTMQNQAPIEIPLDNMYSIP